MIIKDFEAVLREESFNVSQVLETVFGETLTYLSIWLYYGSRDVYTVESAKNVGIGWAEDGVVITEVKILSAFTTLEEALDEYKKTLHSSIR